MANPEHVHLVRRVEDWNKWRAEHPDIVPNLSEADLSRADLSRADLSRANLSRANLSSTHVWETNFGATNLRDAKGLAECNFEGPCILDIRAIELSGMLPVPFLRVAACRTNLLNVCRLS